MIKRILVLGGISIALAFGQGGQAPAGGQAPQGGGGGRGGGGGGRGGRGGGPAPVVHDPNPKLREMFAFDVTIPPNYKAPKTPWGEPDLQGIWPINHLIQVPLVRQKNFEDRIYKND